MDDRFFTDIDYDLLVGVEDKFEGCWLDMPKEFRIICGILFGAGPKTLETKELAGTVVTRYDPTFCNTIMTVVAGDRWMRFCMIRDYRPLPSNRYLISFSVVRKASSPDDLEYFETILRIIC